MTETFVEGFVKRANQIGLNTHEALEVLREKTAALDPQMLQKLIMSLSSRAPEEAIGLNRMAQNFAGAPNAARSGVQTVEHSLHPDIHGPHAPTPEYAAQMPQDSLFRRLAGGASGAMGNHLNWAAPAAGAAGVGGLAALLGRGNQQPDLSQGNGASSEGYQ